MCRRHDSGVSGFVMWSESKNYGRDRKRQVKVIVKYKKAFHGIVGYFGFPTYDIQVVQRIA